MKNDGVVSWERSTEGMMKREFGSPEGTRSYYMVRKVKDATRRKQLIWLMERMFFIVKTTYMSRDNYGLIAAAETGTKVNWAFLLHNRFHAEVLGSDKRKQGGTKLAQMLSILFEDARENKLAIKLSTIKSTPVVKAVVTTKREKKQQVDSEESDEPPTPLKKKARVSESVGGSEEQKMVYSDMAKLGFDQSVVQNAVEETWTEINSKLEVTPLKKDDAQEMKDKGKSFLKISKKKLMFQKDKPGSSKMPKEESQDMGILGSIFGQTGMSNILQESAEPYPTGQLTSVMQNLTEVMLFVRNQDIQVKNSAL